MMHPIDWQALAQQLGTLRPPGVNGGDDPARRALDVIFGDEQLRAAVDHYIAHRPGSELVRKVLRILHSWVASQYCYEVYRSGASIEQRRTAVELLHFIADSRALAWVEEFLAHEDGEIQGWGVALVDQLLFSGRVFPEECMALLDKAEQQANPYVRERATAIKRQLQSSRSRGPHSPPAQGTRKARGKTEGRHLLANGTGTHVSKKVTQTALMSEAVVGALTVAPTGSSFEVTMEPQSRREPIALLEAVAQGDAETVAILLEEGAAEDEQRQSIHIALALAVENGHTAIVRTLLKHGAPVDFPDPRGYTPLLIAADKGHSDIVRLLLEEKAALEAKSTNGDTALMLAAVGGHREAAEVLLEKGAVVSARNRFGRTALMLAACSGQPALVEALLKKGASINTQDWRGHSALIDALSLGHGEAAVLLLAYGAAVNAQDSLKRTPLLLAAEKGYVPIIQALLAKKVDVNVQDENGRTPLLAAVEHAYPRVVKLLLEAGAIPSIPDKEGRIAITVAKELGNEAIVQLLMRIGMRS